jgi:hypothetical protein
MSLKKFQPAILTVDMPAEGLHAGDVGTVVEHHVGAGQGDGYSVEFFDMTGKTVAGPAQRPCARASFSIVRSHPPASAGATYGSGQSKHDRFSQPRIPRQRRG